MKFIQTFPIHLKQIRHKSTHIVDMSFDVYNDIKENAAPLIIMHGLLGSRKNWKSICSQFQKQINPHRKIIAVDARNHGMSPRSDQHTYADLAEDVKALIKKLNVEKSSLLGHCMGGRAMMYFALKYPNFVDKLIIVDVSPVGESPLLKLFSEMLQSLIKIKLPANTSLSDAKRSIKKKLLQENFNEHYVSFVVETNLIEESNKNLSWKSNMQVLVDNFASNLSFFPSMDANIFEGPVLFISGELSKFILKSHETEILKLFPKAEFDVIKGAGHIVHRDKPQEFMKVCSKFLNKY